MAVFSTGNEVASPGEARAAPQLFDSNRFMLMAMLARLGCDVSDLGILRDDRAALSRALRDAAGNHDLVLTSGGVSTGEEDHVRASIEAAAARAVADGDQAGTACCDGRHRRHAVHRSARQSGREFRDLRLCRAPDVLALSGAMQEKLLPMPVRAGFTYKKKTPGANTSAPACEMPPMGARSEKFPREGAGLLSSLCETDGLVELGEDITQVEPGQRSGSCPTRA